ncbi:uncharacterized protein TNCV_921921 [Trichonephila clavipes]|nr:uncharacterized protein TNCV_921921 [Trichonephila clavipes]
MRSIGKGSEAGRMFCGVMNLPQPPTRFSPFGKRILNAAKLVYEDSIQNAAKEAICENEGNKNIAVAVDGTWQKRGYTSLNGVVIVTSIDTGKVIDVDILSKYCACKNLPFHEKDCKRNYVGSSGAMEIQGASKIFQRLLSLHNARYITYLGDGDCKAFDAVKKKNIYGNEYPIEKLECIGHVMKRMGTRLRRLKAQLKGQILSDGKCLSGKNRLTEHEIDNLQSYYGSAIRRNHSSVQNMRQAIWAIFLHKLSTDEYPQHGFCPIGEDSWCGFKRLKHQERLMKAIYAFSGRSKKIRKDKRRKRKKEEDNIKKNKVKSGYSAGSFLMRPYRLPLSVRELYLPLAYISFLVRLAERHLHESNLLESSSNAFKVTGSIAYHHLSSCLATLDLNTLSNLNISYIFLELIRNKREFIFPRKTPKKISGKVPYRFVTKSSKKKTGFIRRPQMA